MSSFLNWRFANENVQTELTVGENVSSESTLILAGPSRLSMLSDTGDGGFLASSNSLIPLGILQNFSMVQNQPVNRIFEVGSKRPYLVPGRSVANFNIARILFYGPSLIRLLYALAPERLVGSFGTPLNVDPDSSGQGVAELPAYDALFPQGDLSGIPGYGGNDNENNRDFYINLTSELFSVPFGMCVLFKSAQDQPYGATYLEDCYIESHQVGIDSNSVVMVETVSGQFSSNRPVNLSSQS